MTLQRAGAIFFFAAMISLMALPCHAKMYKYKKDGVWHYTDSPPREVLKESQAMDGVGGDAPAPSVEGTPLLTEYLASKVRNPIEKVAAATVAIKGGLGYGSGFFISRDGYIITNKHVVRTTSDQAQQEKGYFDAADGRLQEVQAAFDEEKRRLDQFEVKLKELKQLAENEKNSIRKKSYQDELAYRTNSYDQAKADYESRRDKFEAQKKDYLYKKSDYDYGKTVANLSRSFEITLADNIRVAARLVTVSAAHDLALLKIDGYQTPALKPSRATFFQGFPLIAVGNPARLQNTATSGIFSGYENGFIKTNAQIYPGNSGGPLVNVLGEVVGINTFKQLTRKYEGLGFAIPIGKALDEFGRYLR